MTAVNDSVGETVERQRLDGQHAAPRPARRRAARRHRSGAASGRRSGSGSSSSGSSGFVTIDSLGQLEIVAGFAEADATKIAVGQPATITFPALPDTEVAGKVVAVSQHLDGRQQRRHLQRDDRADQPALRRSRRG